MIRRLFMSCIVVAAVLLVLLGMSLFSFQWMNTPRGNLVTLERGGLGVWVCTQGTYANAPTGLSVFGWTGGSLDWRLQFDPAASLYYLPPAAPGAPPPLAVQLRGVRVRVPLLYPLGLTLGVASALWPAWRRSRRTVAGRCPACGYSRAGLGPIDVCPECGAPLVSRAVS